MACARIDKTGSIFIYSGDKID